MRGRILFGAGLFALLLGFGVWRSPRVYATGDPRALVGKATPTPSPTPTLSVEWWQDRFTVPEVGGPNTQGQPQPAWLPPPYPQPWAPTEHDHFLFGRVLPPSYEDIPIAGYRFAARSPESGRLHGGIDIPAPEGTPVLAIGSGRVTWAGEGFTFGRPHKGDPYGLAVVVRHDLGWQGHTLYSLYAHLERIDVQVGQWVAAGTPLGLVGTTGRSDGPHVHVEVRMRQGEEPPQHALLLNPELWIAPPIGWGVLVGQIYDPQGRLWDFGTLTIEPLDWTPAVRALWQGRSKIITHTYGHAGGILADPYYEENFALNNLPAGRYRLRLVMDGHEYKKTVMVYPGRVTFFRFTPEDGFQVVQ